MDHDYWARCAPVERLWNWQNDAQKSAGGQVSHGICRWERSTPPAKRGEDDEGGPATDEDREPWLEVIRRTVEQVAREEMGREGERGR